MLDSAVVETLLLAVLFGVVALRPDLGAPVGKALLNALRRLATRPHLGAAILAVATVIGAALVTVLCGWPIPFFHDEHVYLLAADTFAHGRLTNPPHPQWQHFETFHVLQQPTYAAKYPPVQGLFLAFGQVLGHPAVGLWLAVGLLVLAVGWALLAWLPAPWALAGAALVALRFGVASYWSQSYWGGTAAALGGALLYGALRRVAIFPPDDQRPPRPRDAVAMGLGLAVLANSRPLEGFAISLPAAAVLLAWTVRTWIVPPVGTARPPILPLVTRFLVPILAILALAGGAMGLYNQHVTGDVWTMPYSLHEATYSRMQLFVWQEPRPPGEIEYRHAEIERMHDEAAGQYRPGVVWIGALELWRRAATTLQDYLGVGVIVLLALMARRVFADPWMRFAAAAWAVQPAVHAVTHSYRPHYDAPGTVLLVVLGAAALRRYVERVEMGGGIPPGPPLSKEGGLLRFLGEERWGFVLAGLFGLQLVHLGLQLPCWTADPQRLERARVLETLESTPERDLVVVRYGVGHVPQWEWVYNRADLETAEVVWARDMGQAENRALLEHFADRRAWLVRVGELDADTFERLEPTLVPYPVEPDPSGAPNLSGADDAPVLGSAALRADGD